MGLKVILDGEIKFAGVLKGKDGQKDLKRYQFELEGERGISLPTVTDRTGMSRGEKGDKVRWIVEPWGKVTGKYAEVHYMFVSAEVLEKQGVRV